MLQARETHQRTDAEQPDVDGIVITHGTDTMEETAFFLNLVVKGDKPVVMVGSMRPSTAVSADGPLNLYNAVGVAADPNAKGRGVLVVMNDWIHAAHSLTKTSTTAIQTFMSPLRGVVGVATYGKNDFYNTPAWKHTSTSEFDVAGVTKLPRVDIIFACADMPAGSDRCFGGKWRERHRHRRRRQRQHEQSVARCSGECCEERRDCRQKLACRDGHGWHGTSR